jgi:Lipocalin-like domain
VIYGTTPANRPPTIVGSSFNRDALYANHLTGRGIVKRTLISAVALALVSALSQPAVAEDVSSAIVGVWKMTSWTRKETGSGKLVKTFGERPAGIVIYTKGGHFVTFVAGQDRKAPEKPDPTDAERVELFKSMYGFGGTYKVNGDKLVTHLDTSWNHAWTGTDRPPTVVAIKDKQMTAISSPFKSNLDGQEIVVTTTWERVE